MEDNLRSLAADLSEADRRKDEFLAMLAHELRNPLAPLRNAVQVLRRGGGDGDAVRTASEHAGAAGRADGAPGRRPARREPHHPRQDRAAQGARRAGAGRRAGRRGRRGRSSSSMGHELTVTLPAAAGLPGRRPGAAGPGGRQPAEQRRQVHRHGRPHLADGRARRRRRPSSACATPASASPPSSCRASSRCSPRSTASLERSQRRPGHRPDAGEDAWWRCTAARSRRTATGSGRGSEFVVRLPVAGEAPRRPHAEPAAGPRPAARPPHPDRRRQRGRRGVAGDAAAARRPRDAHGPRRPRGARGRRAAPARRRAARHRPARA